MKQTIIGMVFLLLLPVAGSGHFASAGESCAPAAGMSFVCGPSAAEDLVRVSDTHWIVGSGMSEANNPGKLHLIDAGKKTWEVLYPGAGVQNDPDTKSYPACPGPPDAKTFGAHGIAIRDDGRRTSTLLAINHGREAIEVFRLNSVGTKLAIRWVGCVLMDEHTFANSVAFLPEGGFVATKFYDPTAPEGFQAVMARKPTGGVLEWHPDSGIKPIPGTDLPGANGIEVSKDGKWLYVASWGSQELVRFSRGDGPLRKDVVKVNFSPDNLRWAPDGNIFVAGQNGSLSMEGGVPGFKGWTVVKLDPSTLKVIEVAKDTGKSPLQNASVAIEVDGTLWIGPFRGDRIAYKPLK